MNSDDAIRCKKPKASWVKNVRCAMCREAPTCPMLQDEVWAQVKPELTYENCHVCDHPSDRHYSTANQRGRHCNDCRCEALMYMKELLCLECAEHRLGREITVDDLLPCVANYATYVMMTRNSSQTVEDAERELTLAGVDVPAFLQRVHKAVFDAQGEAARKAGADVKEWTFDVLRQTPRYLNREPTPCTGLCEYGDAGEAPRDLGPNGKPLPGDDLSLACVNCGWLLGDLPKEQS